jgi:hypothetical protein
MEKFKLHSPDLAVLFSNCVAGTRDKSGQTEQKSNPPTHCFSSFVRLVFLPAA